MKKLLCTLILGAMVIGSFAGCGGVASSSSAVETTVAEATTEAATTEATTQSSALSDIAVDTLESYINSDTFQSSLDSMKESLSASGVELDIKAEGSKIIYTCTSTKVELPKDTIEKTLDSTESTYQSMLEGIDTKTNHMFPDMIFEVIYCNPDGSVVTSREFSLEAATTAE